MKITPRAWGDFHARSRFALSTIPEEKWGTTRSLALLALNCARFIKPSVSFKPPLPHKFAPKKAPGGLEGGFKAHPNLSLTEFSYFFSFFTKYTCRLEG